MDIRNVTQFKAFIMQNGLMEVNDAFKNIHLCMEDYSRTCVTCSSDAKRREAYAKCNRLYINTVISIVPQYLPQIFQMCPDSSITFYDDNDLIKTYRR